MYQRFCDESDGEMKYREWRRGASATGVEPVSASGNAPRDRERERKREREKERERERERVTGRGRDMAPDAFAQNSRHCWHTRGAAVRGAQATSV